MRSLLITITSALALLHASANAATIQERQSMVERDVNPCGTSTAGCACVDTTCSYTYTGSPQQFVMPCKGTLSFMTVGAGSNGNPNSGSKVWVQNLSMGEGPVATMPQGDVFVIRVGQEGLAYPDCSSKASFNGGGKCASSKVGANRAYGGGGATDVVYYGQNPIQPAYATVLITAGGAGGQSYSSSSSSFMAGQAANVGHICSKAATPAAKTKYATSGPMTCTGQGSGAGGGGGGYPAGQAGKISKKVGTGGYQGQSFVRGGSYEIPTGTMTAGVQITYTCSA